MKLGYVYIMRNPAFPHLIKIGYTTLCPYKRAAELSAETGVPAPFEVVHYREMSNPHEYEQGLHCQFAKYRYSANREFFEMSAKPVITLLSDVKLSKREKALSQSVKNAIRRKRWHDAKTRKEAKTTAELLAIPASLRMFNSEEIAAMKAA